MRVLKNVKIGVLMGGLSAEREVSLRSGKALLQALVDRGYVNACAIDVGQNVHKDLERHCIEVAVLALHGRYGEDGCIQGLLECLKIPYTGSGVLGSAVAMNKVVSKELFVRSGVPTPKWWVSDSRDEHVLPKEIAQKLGFPSICKPIDEGSTFGLTVVKSISEVMEAQLKALEFGTKTLWEEFIVGSELTVGVLMGRPLPVVEIVPKSGLYDYESKYTKGKTDYYCPARISQEDVRRVQRVALDAFKSVYAEDYGRVDVLLSQKGPTVLEVNTLPGMTETSLIPKAAGAAGISFGELAEQILQGARLKQGVF